VDRRPKPGEKSGVEGSSAALTIWHPCSLLFTLVHVVPFPLNCVSFHYNTSTDGKANGQNKNHRIYPLLKASMSSKRMAGKFTQF
jgi:hypothetical protein